jgi:two-component system, OmpR family, sensor histidine kinase CpxA
MRTFFLQIFLAFWVSTIAIFAVATALNPDGHHGSLENIFAFAQEDAARVSSIAVGAYHWHECEGLAHMGDHYLLADGHGNVLCGATVSPKLQQVIRNALAQHQFQTVHDDNMWVTATPVDDQGTTYIVIHRRPYAPRPYFPHLPGVALPVSLLVTFLFAFVLTRPVRALSRAFRQFSAGDLSVRLPVERRWWSGLGGSDVHTLMLDFNHMADRVGSLIQAQKMLVRDVSHELRSPLTRLRLALEMERDEAQASSPFLDRMQTETERVNELIGQMLTLSLMESTRELPSRDRVDIGELILSLLPDLEFEATARNCSVRLVQEERGLFVTGSAELLRRAIENIVRNAIRFTAAGTEVEVTVRTDESGEKKRSVAEIPRMIAVDVADRGPGVPEESLGLLFRAFYRTDAARRDTTGGFGVGLSIAERAIHLHGGTVFARNRDKGGLIVSIRLLEQQTEAAGS